MTVAAPMTRCRCSLSSRALFRLFAFILFALVLLLSPSLPALAAPETQDDDQTLYHEVMPGETLSEIAKAYGVEMETLLILNGIADQDAIVIGQRLRMPLGTEAPVTATPLPEPSATPTSVPTATATATATAAPVATDDASTANTSPSRDIPVVDSGASTTLNRSYTVELNDTLADIALRVGVDLGALGRLNRLDATSPLRAGQELLLPATTIELQVKTAEESVVVSPGDSLGAIAAEFDVGLPDLMRANGLSNPDAISIGQSLVIPPKPVSADEVERVGPPRSGFDYYTVAIGDTLSEIGRDFDTPVLALLEYNGLPNEETVYSGLELRIPYGAPPLPQDLPPVPISGTSFMVSLSRQQCWLFHGGELEKSWTCSTGYGDWITRTGTFNVKTKMELAKSGAYRLDMPYWLGLYDVGDFENGIHGIPVEWETGEKLWDGLVGQPATFGCAMLADEDAAALFNAAFLGMPVHVIE